MELDHVIGGHDDGERGYKTRHIESETGCVVEISHADRTRNTSMYLTIRPMFDVATEANSAM